MSGGRYFPRPYTMAELYDRFAVRAREAQATNGGVGWCTEDEYDRLMDSIDAHAPQFRAAGRVLVLGVDWRVHPSEYTPDSALREEALAIMGPHED